MFTELLELQISGETRFDVLPSPAKDERVFGGQFLAQSLQAAQLTVDDEREVHSLHAYFLRPGDVDLPMRFTVGIVRDGRAFSARQVVAEQQGRTLFHMLVSFQRPDNTPLYACETMPEVPPPEEVMVTYDEFTLQQTGEEDWPGSKRPMDIRYINPPGKRGIPVNEAQLMWMRLSEPLSSDPRLHRAGLVYLSDSTIVDQVMLPHGLRWQDDDFIGVSLDHAMWFHQSARADEWLLFVQNAEATGKGRGLASGRFLIAQAR